MNIWVEPVEWDAEKEGGGNNVIELKEGGEDTKGTKQGKSGEGEENGVKTEMPPIVQIEVEVENFVAGQSVRGSRAIDVAPNENCAWLLLFHFRSVVGMLMLSGNRGPPLVHLAQLAGSLQDPREPRICEREAVPCMEFPGEY